MIRQGDIYWIPADALTPSSPGADHPYVVLQADVLNQGRIDTTVVCALTTNPKRANEPGNVRLEAGEADLPRPSVVVVSQLCTVEKARLGAYIGTLRATRVAEILAGIGFQQRSQLIR
ncbi:MAG: type II toxin-antitoxin system PemK/MazF family toxin [Nannocystaceae bacterium]